MANSLVVVRRMLYNYVKREEAVFGDIDDSLDEYVLSGVAKAGMVLGRNYFSLVDSFGEKEFENIETAKMGNSEVILAVYCSYLEFAINFHHNMTKKATNFKSASFAISGTTERAKEAMRIVWWCDGKIKETLDLIERVGVPDAEPPIDGTSVAAGFVKEISFLDHHIVF